VVEADSVEALKALGDKVKGKIVLWNKRMERAPTGEGYGQVVGLRGKGAIEAARLGAVGSLIRSVGTGSYRLPHTGGTRYDDKITKIPFAALSAEDADHLHRLLGTGEPVKVRLKLGAHRAADVTSNNVVGEVPGREKPDEIVLIGAHIDSWDVGQGAQDDGTGCAIVMEALATLRRLGLAPRRTIRAVLFTSEEIGARGGHAYAERHAAELPRHVGAFETDVGAGTPLGISMDAAPAAIGEARALAPLLAPIGATAVDSGFAGADVEPMRAAGVPLVGLSSDPTHYFDIHHSVADTLDKIDPAALGRNVAAMATWAFLVADRPTRWAGAPPPDAGTKR